MNNEPILGPDSAGRVRVLKFHDRVNYLLNSQSIFLPPSCDYGQVESIGREKTMIQQDGKYFDIDSTQVLNAGERLHDDVTVGHDRLHVFDFEDLIQSVPLLIRRLNCKQSLTWIGPNNMVHLHKSCDSQNTIPTAENLAQAKNSLDMDGHQRMATKICSNVHVNGNNVLCYGEGNTLQDAVAVVMRRFQLIDAPSAINFQAVLGVLQSVFCDESDNVHGGIEFKVEMFRQERVLEDYLQLHAAVESDAIRRYITWKKAPPVVKLRSVTISEWTLNSAKWIQTTARNALTQINPQTKLAITTDSVIPGLSVPLGYGHKLSVLWSATVTRSLRENILAEIHEHDGISALTIARYIKNMDINSLLTDTYSTLYMRRKRLDITPMFTWFKHVNDLGMSRDVVTRILKLALAAEFLDVSSKLMLDIHVRTPMSTQSKSYPYITQSLVLIYGRDSEAVKKWRQILKTNPYWISTVHQLCLKEMTQHVIRFLNAAFSKCVDPKLELSSNLPSTLRVIVFPHNAETSVVQGQSGDSVRLVTLSSLLGDYQNIRLWTLLRHLYLNRDKVFFEKDKLSYPPLDSQLGLDLLESEGYRKSGGLMTLISACSYRLSKLNIAQQSFVGILAEAICFSDMAFKRREVRRILQPLSSNQKIDLLTECIVWSVIMVFTELEMTSDIPRDLPVHQYKHLTTLTDTEKDLLKAATDDDKQTPPKGPVQEAFSSVLAREHGFHDRLRPYMSLYSGGRDPAAAILDFRILIKELLLTNPYLQTSCGKETFTGIPSWYLTQQANAPQTGSRENIVKFNSKVAVASKWPGPDSEKATPLRRAGTEQYLKHAESDILQPRRSRTMTGESTPHSSPAVPKRETLSISVLKPDLPPSSSSSSSEHVDLKGPSAGVSYRSDHSRRFSHVTGIEPVDLSFLPVQHKKFITSSGCYITNRMIEIDKKIKELYDLSQNDQENNGGTEFWTIHRVIVDGDWESEYPCDPNELQNVCNKLYTSGSLCLLERAVRRFPVRIKYDSFVKMFNGSEAKLEAKAAAENLLGRMHGLVSGVDYGLGESYIFLQQRVWDILLCERLNVLDVDKSSSLKRCVQFLIDRWRFLRLRHIITRLQARWRLRLYERRMGNNRALFIPLFLGLLKAGLMVVPYVGVGKVSQRTPHAAVKNLTTANQFRDAAATTIQNWWRSMQAQRELRRRKKEFVRTEAAEFIQGLARTLICTSKVASSIALMTAATQDERAATKIQRSLMIPKYVEDYKMLRDGIRMMILPIHRLSDRLIFATSARRKLRASLGSSESDQSKRIPSIDDGPLEAILRDQYILRSGNHNAVVKIQSAWRGYFIRNQMRALKRACQIVQTFINTQIMRRKFVDSRLSAIRIQRWWRIMLQYRRNRIHTAGAVPVRERMRDPRMVIVWINSFLTYLNVPGQNVSSRRRRISAGDNIIEAMKAKFQRRIDAVERCHRGFSAFYDAKTDQDLPRFRDPRDLKVCFISFYNSAPRSTKHAYANYGSVGGWAWPIFVLLRRYMISTMVRSTRKWRQYLRSRQTGTDEEQQLDNSIYGTSIEPDEMDQFTKPDMRALVAPFEHFVNSAKSHTKLVSRPLHMEREAFELRSIVIGSRSSYLILAESLSSFFGRALRGHARLSAILDNQVSCLFAWGANDEMQLTYRHCSVPISFLEQFSGKMAGEVTNYVTSGASNPHKIGICLIRIEHTHTRRAAERIWRSNVGKRKTRRHELERLKEVMSARQLVETELAFSSTASEDEACPDFTHPLSRTVDYTFRVVEVQAGEDFAIARTNDGRLFSWGTNRDGRCGQGFQTVVVPQPTLIPIINNGNRRVIQYSVGLRHAMALVEGNFVYIWGAQGFVHLLRNKTRGGAFPSDRRVEGEDDPLAQGLDDTSDFFFPVRIPLDQFLFPKSATSLDLIKRRELYKYDAQEPGWEFKELVATRKGSARFDSVKEHNSFERLNMAEDGRYSDEDSEEGLGLDPKNWRTKMRQEQAAWIRRQEELAEKRAEVRRLRKLRAEQIERRMLRRDKYQRELIQAKKEAYDNAVRRFNEEYGNLRPDEVAEKAASDPNVVVTRNGNKVRIQVVADDIMEPRREPDSDNDIEVPDMDDEPESWRSYWDPVPLHLRTEVPTEREGYEMVIGEKPPTIEPPGKPRDVFHMSWRGVSRNERRWIELMQMIRASQWDVAEVVAGRGNNYILLRCRDKSIKDILLVWGRNNVGQLGLPVRVTRVVKRIKEPPKKIGQFQLRSNRKPVEEERQESTTSTLKDPLFGWCPLFMWFGSRTNLKDEAFKVVKLAVGMDYAAVLCRGWSNLPQRVVLFWGCFPVIGYNKLRHANENDPYAIDKYERQANKSDYWVIGRVSFAFPIPLEDVNDQIVDLSASQGEYRLCLTTRRGEVLSITRFMVMPVDKSPTRITQMLDQTSFIHAAVPYNDTNVKIRPDVVSLWKPELSGVTIATESTGWYPNNSAHLQMTSSSIDRGASAG